MHHLGDADYGLWMLTTGVTTYFSVLELGYGGAIVKFVAEFRAKRDPRALNEVLSTMFFVYSASAPSPTWRRSASRSRCRTSSTSSPGRPASGSSCC